MAMSERLTQLPFKPILAKEVVPAENGTLINGELFNTITPEKFNEAREAAEIANACIFHREGEKMAVICPDGVKPPFKEIAKDFELPVQQELPMPIGKAVKNPVVAKTLMEEAALKHLTQLEEAHIPSVDLDNHLNRMVDHIEDVAGRLQTPSAAQRARHEAIHFIKRAELPAAILASAVVFAASKA